MGKKLTSLVLLIITCVTISAQVSPYLDKGKSGLGVYAAYEEGYDFTGYHGILAYSLGAKFDISLCLSQSFYNKWAEDLLNLDAKDIYYSGQFTWWMFKEKLTSNIEVNVGPNIGIEYSKYTDYVYPEGQYNGYTGGWVGLNSNINFFLPKRIIFTPHLNISKGFGLDRYTTSGVEDNEFYYGTTATYGVSIAKKTKDDSIIYLTVEQSNSNFNQHNTYYFGAGYVIPF
jgi:hypothetical protein